MGITTVGYEHNEDEPPKLIQTFLKKKGITIEELKSNQQLIQQLKTNLYQIIGKEPPQTQKFQLHKRNFGKFPPNSFYQVIIDNNIFRPLGYKKTSGR